MLHMNVAYVRSSEFVDGEKKSTRNQLVLRGRGPMLVVDWSVRLHREHEAHLFLGHIGFVRGFFASKS